MIPLLLVLVVADTNWTKGQQTLALVAGASVVADCVSTMTVPGRETNPLLGPAPSDGEVATLCAVGLAASWVLADLLPKKLRSLFLLGLTAVEMQNTLHNVYGVGVRIPL
jgi:hypothetical protein